MIFSSQAVLGQLHANFLNQLCTLSQEKHLASGQKLCTKGEDFDGAFLVVKGRLADPESTIEFVSGDVVDELQLLTGGQRAHTLIAFEECQLFHILPDQFRTLVAKDKPILEQLSSLVSDRLRHQQVADIIYRLFGSLDDSVKNEIESKIIWLELAPSEVLFRQSDPGDALYAVIDGRLAVLSETDKGPLLLNEILPGETIGEISIITNEPRSATVKASSRSLLIKFERLDFDRIVEQHPIIYKAFAEVLATWLQRNNSHQFAKNDAKEVTLVTHRQDGTLMRQLSAELEVSLSKLGLTLCLSSDKLNAMGARYLFDVDKALKFPLYHSDNTRFRLWLAEQKRHYAYIIYETDGYLSTWDKLCVERAHELIIAADSGAKVAPGDLELLSCKNEMTKHRLVLIQPNHASPENTDKWLCNRALTGHHHLRLDSSADFQRLARFIAGKAVGLVLAGGGARGFAHVGIIRAMHEQGIPIDLIGGTSSGGMIGLSYSIDTDPNNLESRNEKQWVAKKPFSRLTIPIISILDHTKWDQIFKEAVGNKRIEDLWIPTFCISCNIDTGETVVHGSGLVWKAARATASLPVFLAPTLIEGQAHIDGGVVNNLPIDVMRKMTAGPVFAINLEHIVKNRLALEDYPSPWRLALEKIPGFRKKKPYHTISKVIMQLAVMLNDSDYEKRTKLADFILEPPVEDYALTDIKHYDEITKIGHAYGIEHIEQLMHDEIFKAKMASAGIRYSKKESED